MLLCFEVLDELGDPRSRYPPQFSDFDAAEPPRAQQVIELVPADALPDRGSRTAAVRIAASSFATTVASRHRG